jgi:hypothetical protein
MTPNNKIARTAGALYLTFGVMFAFSFFVQAKPLVSGDSTAAAVATAKNILASQFLFRLGFVSEVVAVMFFVLAAWALYVLLKPVNKNLALLFVLVNLAGVAIECSSTAAHFAALMLLSDAEYLKAFRPDQLQAMATFFLNYDGIGQLIAALFYGVWLFPLGYLIYKSGFLPKALGALLILDGFCVPTFFFMGFLFPGHDKLLYPLYPVMFIAEFGLALWLLIKGVNDRRPSLVESGLSTKVA